METGDKRAMIEGMIAEQEEAIRKRGFGELYTRCRDAFLQGDEVNWQNPNPDDVQLIQRYLLTSSFIAAHFRLANDKERRDKAAQSCSLLLSTLGHDPIVLLENHIELENHWLRTFRYEGITGPPKGCIVLIIAAILGSAALAYFLWF